MTPKSIRILLAEDEEHIAKLIQFKLGREGFVVGWAKDGREATSLLQSEKVMNQENLGTRLRAHSWDAIVLDVMMPYLDGWRVLKEIRENQDSTPVLMLTAKGAENDISKSIGLGATRFLKKPFNPSELVEVLNKMLAEERIPKEVASSVEIDPEIRKLKDEFAASFADRKAILRKCLTRLSDIPFDGKAKSDRQEELELITLEIRIVAHNLAGIAKNYGFLELGSQATTIDDELGIESKPRTKQELISFCERLDNAMI